MTGSTRRTTAVTVQPLRAKKKHDYALWRQMVLLQAEYFRRPWPDGVRRRMADMYQQLKTGRLLHGWG